MDKLSLDVEKNIMSLAEKLREEGGLNKSIEIAKKMLADGVDPVFVAKYTEIPLDQVKKLKTKN